MALSKNFQNTNTPDFDLERDLELTDEIILGTEIGNLETKNVPSEIQFRVNITTIVISALIFLAILAWFDFIQSTYYEWTNPGLEVTITSRSRLGYAVGVTLFITGIIVIIYYYSRYI